MVMALQLLKFIESTFFSYDITYSLCIIAVIAMFTIVYLISIMGTKERTFEEAKAAQNNDVYKKKGFWLLSYIVPRTIHKEVVKAKFLKEKMKLNMVSKGNHKNFSYQAKDKQKINSSSKIIKTFADGGRDLDLGIISDAPKNTIKYDKSISQQDITSTKFTKHRKYGSLSKAENFSANDDTTQANLLCDVHLNTCQNNSSSNVFEKHMEFESSSCNEFIEQNGDNKNISANNIKANKKHKKRNKKCKNLLIGTHEEDNQKGNASIVISDHTHVDGSRVCAEVAEEANQRPDVPEALEERLIKECTNLPRGKLLLLLDTLMQDKKIDGKEIKLIQQLRDSMQKHVDELEAKVHESQSLMKNANMQNQKLSNDHGQERLKYVKLENSLKEKMLSMNQELQVLHSRLNEAQRYQHKVIALQKALDDAKANHTFALNALKEENKRCHENYSQKDNDAKVLEKKMLQLEASFKKDLEAKVKASEDKVTYMAKQNERLLNQIKFMEQDNARNKDQFQILLGEKTNALAKCDELSLKLLDVSRDLESFKERNKIITQFDKEGRERENKLYSEIVNHLKGMRSELCLSQEFLSSILNVVPQKNEQMLNDVYVNISKDVAKTQNLVQVEMEKMGVVVGEMSRTLKSLSDPISQHGHQLAATNNLTSEVLIHTKNSIQSILHSWGKQLQHNEDHWRLEINETIDRFRKIVDDLRDIKTNAHKKEGPKLMTSLNETTSFLTTDNYSMTPPESLLKDYELKIQELKNTNDDLRKKNWKIVEALKDKDNFITEHLKQRDMDEESNNHATKVKLTERTNIIKIIQKLCENLGDPMDFNGFVTGDDKFYSTLFEKALQPIIYKNFENKEKITVLKREIEIMEDLKIQLAKQQTKHEEPFKTAKENELAGNVLGEILISVKKHLLAIKAQVEDNERCVDKQIELQMELSRGGLENYNPKLSLSKPFVLPRFAKLHKEKDLKYYDKVCQSDLHPSLQEPWIEVIIEPLADPSLLRELEGYKMKLQNLQRELVAFQSLSINIQAD